MGRVQKLTRCLLALLLMYAAYEIVPPYLRAYVFHDDIERIAREATFDANKAERDASGSPRPIEERVRDEVMLRAMDLDIALSPEHLQVMRDDQTVIINADYKIRADLIVRQFDLNFQVTSQRQ